METPVTMSERVTFVLVTVLSPLHSVVGDDIFSVRANTMLVKSLICLFISMKRRSTELKLELCLTLIKSPFSNSFI